MNVETGAKAAQFPEKEYINGIAVAVQLSYSWLSCLCYVQGTLSLNCKLSMANFVTEFPYNLIPVYLVVTLALK